MKLSYNQVESTILDIKQDKRTEVFNFGLDNAYPSLIKALLDVSVTAKTCSDRVAKSIYGKSFGEVGKVIVNSKGQSLNEVLRITAKEYADQNNAYLHIGYNGNLEFNSINFIPSTDSRIDKADDRGYSGKFIVYNNWDKSKGKKIKSEDFIIVDRFNPNKEIIKRQIEASGKDGENGTIEDYNGQIIHIKKDQSSLYSLSDFHCVLDEMLLEANSQKFRSRGASKGFLNTKLLATQPMKDDNERREFKKELNEVRGAENSSEVVHMEASQQLDDLSKQIYVADLSSPFNDKLFEYSDNRAEKNICKASSVPIILVSQTDNSIFGNSGELLKEAKIQLWESREEDRDQLEEVFSMLMKGFTKPIEKDLKILNPYIDEDEEKQAKNLNKQSQATLRGSVGGVTAITQLLQSVSQGLVGRMEAVAVVKNIYGFNDKQAKMMVGGFNEDGELIGTNQQTIVNNG